MGPLPFISDSRLVSTVVPSQNHGERRAAIDILLLHYTGMPDADGALQRLCDPASEVSTHYFVFDDGRLVQCVPEARRAWHAGEASWGGAADINSRSIGIEIANPGHGWHYDDFPDAQIAAVIALGRDILARRPIPPWRVLAHSDVAPMRKQDPGEKFPWDRLAAAGVGAWVAPEPITQSVALTMGDKGPKVRDLQAQLGEYGYGLLATGQYDEATRAVVAAFQRHFRPGRVDGLADTSTLRTLSKLLAARAAVG
ncbi:MAG: N-acetylmuramoyl-L-alanine amidase [Xanthobacteraceae bacterium]